MKRRGSFRRMTGQIIGLPIAIIALLLAGPQAPVAQQQSTPIDSTIQHCSDFYVKLLGLLDPGTPDPGWVHVNKGNPQYPKFQNVTGVVVESQVSHTDLPDNHESHDMNFDVLVDPGLENVLSESS